MMCSRKISSWLRALSIALVGPSGIVELNLVLFSIGRGDISDIDADRGRLRVSTSSPCPAGELFWAGFTSRLAKASFDIKSEKRRRCSKQSRFCIRASILLRNDCAGGVVDIVGFVA